MNDPLLVALSILMAIVVLAAIIAGILVGLDVIGPDGWV